MTGEGELVGGRYRLDQRIGSGAMGVVWQGYDERLRRAVAVKQLRLEPGLDPREAQEARERAMREGRIAARLHHPNAVTVFDVVDYGGAPWLVMEYVPSRSLAAEMAERGVLQPEEVGRIGAQVAHALVAAHSAGIVHRDIKPANILLGDTGVVKITDFGISRATGDVAVTKTGLIAGTPAYLAPEVAYGRPPEAPSDVFSLGSTLFAAVEGEPPFGLSENTLGLLHAVAAGRINPPQQAGILTDVLVHLLDPDPDRRPNAVTAAWWLDSVARGERPDIAPISDETLAAMGAETTFAPAPTARTRPIAGVGYVGPATSRGPAGLRDGRPTSELDRPRRSRRPMVLAGLGIAAVAAVAALLLMNGALNDRTTPTPSPVNNSGPTGAGNPQAPAQTSDPFATTASPTRHTRTSGQATTTTNPVPTTTTVTITTTTTPPTSSSSSSVKPPPTSVPPPTTVP